MLQGCVLLTTAPDETRGSNMTAPTAHDNTPSENARQAEDVQRVQAAIVQLANELDQRIIQLRFVDGQSLAQIASALSLSYDEVRRRFNAAMTKLAHELRELY